jgi:hypothetical protein
MGPIIRWPCSVVLEPDSCLTRPERFHIFHIFCIHYRTILSFIYNVEIMLYKSGLVIMGRARLEYDATASIWVPVLSLVLFNSFISVLWNKICNFYVGMWRSNNFIPNKKWPEWARLFGDHVYVQLLQFGFLSSLRFCLILSSQCLWNKICNFYVGLWRSNKFIPNEKWPEWARLFGDHVQFS